MTLRLVTPPAVEPLTVAEAKARLNIGAEVPDAVMGALITAARQMIDGSGGWIGRAINTQTWDLVLDRFPDADPYALEKGFYPRAYGDCSSYPYQAQGIPIPLPPLQSVTSVTYLDTNAVLQTFDSANYSVLKGEPSRIILANGAAWPSALWAMGSVIVRFVAGYGDVGSDVDERIRMAIALQVGHLRSLSSQNLFLNREEVTGVYSRGWTVGTGADAAISQASKALLDGLRVWT